MILPVPWKGFARYLNAVAGILRKGLANPNGYVKHQLVKLNKPSKEDCEIHNIFEKRIE